MVVTTCDPMARVIGRHLNEVALNTYAICRDRGALATCRGIADTDPDITHQINHSLRRKGEL